MEQLHDKITGWLSDPMADFFEGIGLLSQLVTNRMLIRNLSRKDSKYNREKLSHELRKQLRHLPSITTTQQIEQTDPGKDVHTTPDEVNIEDQEEPPVGPAGGEHTEQEPKTCPPVDPQTGVFPPLPPIDINQKALPPSTSTPNPMDAKVAEQLEISYSKMFNKRGMLANSLRKFIETDNAGRKHVMEQIASINGDMNSIRAKLDHFKEHGQLPAKQDPAPVHPSPTETVIPDDPILMKNLLLNTRSTISKLRKKIAEGADPDKLQELEADLQKKTELANEIQRRQHGAG